ncbi:helix-turn-helix domain-containing protein [Methyloversatilis discipulorum]|uniref:helix-turn-helix domain-containing protein n=1 Tax=Methyloversatilis discipulorum TaxID=1119528 RepID=UPI001A5FCF6A|nr:helix-turn-helix transcriptional regulator [Methyloversatilis discipulorum]MBL8467753.1 helix-turn-helix transcriptional regulator [Methyloversatilis discipulorum]
MTAAVKNPLKDLKAYRLSFGENQTQFWARFLVTQSGGSRYESGRDVPAPTAMLMLAFSEGLLDDEILAKLAKKVITT